WVRHARARGLRRPTTTPTCYPDQECKRVHSPCNDGGPVSTAPTYKRTAAWIAAAVTAAAAIGITASLLAASPSGPHAVAPVRAEGTTDQSFYFVMTDRF